MPEDVTRSQFYVWKNFSLFLEEANSFVSSLNRTCEMVQTPPEISMDADQFPERNKQESQFSDVFLEMVLFFLINFTFQSSEDLSESRHNLDLCTPLHLSFTEGKLQNQVFATLQQVRTE